MVPDLVLKALVVLTSDASPWVSKTVILGLHAGCFFVSDEILATNGILAVVTLGMVCACFGPKPDAAWQGARTSSDNTLTEQVDTIWCAAVSLTSDDIMGCFDRRSFAVEMLANRDLLLSPAALQWKLGSKQCVRCDMMQTV